MPPIKTLVVDDSIAMRRTLIQILNSQEDIEVVGQAKDGVEALEMFNDLDPDIVILDLVMPKLDGKDALKQILNKRKNAKVLIASSLGGQQEIEECLSIGAINYIQKPYAEDNLFSAVRSAYRAE